MKARYFIITGLNEGERIEPYVTETNGTLPDEIMNVSYGDYVRYYEEIEREEYEEMKGVSEKYKLFYDVPTW